MYGGNLSYDQLRRYLNVLTRQEILAKNHLGVYQITTKGCHTLELVSVVVAVLEDLHAELDGDRSGEGPLAGNGHREEQAVAVD